jgi:hypothetical protein
MAITWISWGAAPGYINTAPLGLKGSCLNYKSFSKSPIYSLLEYIYCTLKGSARELVGFSLTVLLDLGFSRWRAVWKLPPYYTIAFQKNIL